MVHLKNASKIRQLKDGGEYISSNAVDKSQNNLLKIVENESKDDDYSVNFLTLKTIKRKNEEMEQIKNVWR